MTTTTKTVEERAREYADLLTELNDSIWKGVCPANERDYTLKKGRRFWKLIQSSRHSQDQSVHCFIEAASGDIYKAASWTAPAKGVRYRLMNDASRESMYRTLRASAKQGSLHCGYLYD